MKAYLQFGKDNGPFLTKEVPVKVTEEPRSGRTASGYGSKLPTQYKVEYLDRWRRVYVAQYGNAGTAYIGKPGQWLATVEIEADA